MLERDDGSFCEPEGAYFFFLLLACDKSEPATDFSDLLDELLFSSFEAIEAGFLPVAMILSFKLEQNKNVELLFSFRLGRQRFRGSYAKQIRPKARRANAPDRLILGGQFGGASAEPNVRSAASNPESG